MKTKINVNKDLYLKVKDDVICYDDFGEGEIPVIFIHGFPFDKTSWRFQMEALCLSDRVIAYDIRGFGKSTGPSRNSSISLFADDLIGFMDGLKIERSIVCGLSMGGYIILNALSRYNERFEALILSDTQCIADTDEGREGRRRTILQIEAEGLGNFADGFVKKLFCGKTLESNQALVEEIKEIILSTSPKVITGTLAALAGREETCTLLKKVGTPTLILCGKEDTITPPMQSQLMQRTLENSVFHEIENAGHLSNLEQPEGFNRYLNEFISMHRK